MKNIFLLLIAFGFIFVGCEDDDENIRVELAQGKYYLEDDPDDYVKHYIYEFYQKYGTVILCSPQPEDYVYNFTNSNSLELVPPVQEESVLRAGFEMFDELFLSFYNDDFKKKYLPFTLQLADTIKRITNKTYYHDYYVSRNFVALGNIDSDLASMTDEKKDEISKGMHYSFWFKYLLGQRKAISIPAAFFNYGKDYYGEDLAIEDKEIYYSDEMSDLEKAVYLLNIARDNGFITYSGFEDAKYKYRDYPSRDSDLESFFSNIFLTTHAEFKEIRDAYSAIDNKYEILRTAFLEQVGFDIATINNEDI